MSPIGYETAKKDIAIISKIFRNNNYKNNNTRYKYKIKLLNNHKNALIKLQNYCKRSMWT